VKLYLKLHIDITLHYYLENFIKMEVDSCQNLVTLHGDKVHAVMQMILCKYFEIN